MRVATCSLGFFFNAPATPEIYTLSLHDALPIYLEGVIDAGGFDISLTDRPAQWDRCIEWLEAAI